MNGAMERQTLVFVVVLNYCRADDTIDCVRSLRRSEGLKPEIIVVDNGSDDDSVERIAGAFPDVQVVRNASNLGYAGGNNVGIERALKDGAAYVLVVNNDCTVAPDAVGKMVDAACARDADIVSPKVYDFFKPDVIQYAGYRNVHLLGQGLPIGEGERDEGQYDQETELNAAPGCAMLLGRRFLESVGLFDERFFAYSEELDLCRRARTAGCRILFVPSARVWHKKAATLNLWGPEYTYYLTRGRLIYARKHLGWGAFLLVFLPYFVVVKMLKPMAVFAILGRWWNIDALFRAVWWNVRNKVER
jgi:GT2 family glycosyltransferase